ncbi:YidC/Oxa1 family membrane protein insertase [Dehalobacterium formicoaceticum]|uniref:YidC/Oxa1 family membrane protein insertase n=1 Tax=Dehalobacterium formicoaceticum TaxID=51515 RepID=A0ABT1Y437_9FIRM|nr:YidC/Oxa1 family membrane protein insertase [Dehalobacterium formicoaceticum]MCR6545643.1 YidC/Oxa1 family membrane protein insertase [Dehalobacterium formicoaceticum]
MGTLIGFVTDSLEWLYQLTVQINMPSYALAIVLLTIIIKVLLYPLTYKQMKSMKVMQQLQPIIKELDQKYKNNPQKKQEEMMKVYQEYGANPMAGCLPLLIQFPILIALFRGLQSFHPSIPEHYNFFWINDLSLADPSGFILPVFVGLTTFLQQYITSPNSNDPTQKMMLYAMPILFGWMTRSFPAGLALYWIAFSVVGTIQQIFINRGIKPTPVEDTAKDKNKKKHLPVKESEKK